MKSEAVKMLLVTIPMIVVYTWGFDWIWSEYIGGTAGYSKLLAFGVGLIVLVRFTARGFYRKIREIKEGGTEN